MTDFRVQDHGSILVLRPVTEAAKEWASDHLPQDAQQWACGTVIERRYFSDIYYGLRSDGLTIE